MPSKGKRTAVRQAKLRDKRRRGKGAPHTFDAGPTEADVAARPEPTQPARAQRDEERTAAPARPIRRTRQAAASDTTPLTYPYLGVELRRIGIMTMGVFVILAVATFVLG